MQSQARFEKVPEKIPSRETLVQNQVKFNRVPEKVCRALVRRSSVWLRSTLHKNVPNKNVAAVADTTAHYFGIGPCLCCSSK